MAQSVAVSSKLNSCTHYYNSNNNNSNKNNKSNNNSNNNNNNTLKANPDDNTLKANPALCKHSKTTIKTTAQVMHL